MACEGGDFLFAMTRMTAMKACKLLTPLLGAAERAVGCVPELPVVSPAGQLPSLGPQTLSLPFQRRGMEVNTLGWENQTGLFLSAVWGK